MLFGPEEKGAEEGADCPELAGDVAGIVPPLDGVEALGEGATDPEALAVESDGAKVGLGSVLTPVGTAPEVGITPDAEDEGAGTEEPPDVGAIPDCVLPCVIAVAVPVGRVPVGAVPVGAVPVG